MSLPASLRARPGLLLVAEHPGYAPELVDFEQGARIVLEPAAVIRLRWDRSHAPRVRRSWRLLAFGILFLILTGVATFRAVSI